MDALLRAYLWLNRERPSILHSWMYHANMSGRILGHLARVPFIISSRRAEYIGGRGRQWINRITAPLADKTIAVSESARRNELRETRRREEDVVTICNGVDNALLDREQQYSRHQARDILGIPHDAILIGTVAKFRKEKALPDIVDAFAILASTRPSLHLALIGDGDERGYLEQQIQSRGLGHRVHIAGLRTDATSLLSAIDVFVLASMVEGMPNAILEAMAQGLPVVATRVGGVPELVIDGQTGYLSPASNSKALAGKIAILLDDEAARMEFGEHARERIREKFTIQRTVRATEDLYREVMCQRHD